jgi:DNA polymerase III epsilon subunit-like protein
MTPIIIDVEASGFGRGSYPLEVGVVLPDGSRHCYLITPARGWKHWDDDAEALHGISRETLSAYGRPLREVAWRLNELLLNKTAYSDAWSFDMSWLGKLFDAADIPQRFRIADLSELLDEEQQRLWGALKQRVADDLGLQRHRASGDARILQETWLRLQRRAA